ncbi:MAG: carboxypeptidase regulatory-like domain-containing protein [Armatimonadetes bacterium]|nr:carboxypeptidase regulatory-like domain-containing protein [Armatimonadota bacterium]
MHLTSLICRSRAPRWAAVVLLILAGAPAQARGARAGAITGQISGIAPVEMARLSFYLDGAPAQARLSRRGFRMRGVPPGTHSLAVLSPDGQRGAHVSAYVRAGRSTSVGTLDLAVGGQIAGLVSRIVEDGGLEPLPGVEVVAEPAATILSRRTHGDDPTDPVPNRLVAITDETGAYAFRAVPPGEWQVSVVVPGYTAGVEFVFVEPGRTAVADFILEPEIAPGVGTVEGVVTGADGNPIEGALVTVYAGSPYVPHGVSRRSLDHAWRKGRLGSVPPDLFLRQEFATLTDQEGYYRLNVPSGRLVVTASASGYEPAEQHVLLYPRETIRVDFQLSPVVEPAGGTVAGQVTDAETGTPIAGAIVTVAQPGLPPQSGRKSHPIRWEWTAITNEQGEFAIDAIPAGTWLLTVEAEGYYSSVSEVVVHEHETTVVQVYLQHGQRRH